MSDNGKLNENAALLELLKGQNAFWEGQKPTIGEEEWKALAGKKGHLAWLDVFTKARAKREKLLRQGQLVYGYCFKECLVSGGDPVIPTWVLLSPSLADFDFAAVKEAAGKLLDLAHEPVKPYRHNQLYWKMRDSLAKASYFEIPPAYSGKLLYLCIFERRIEEYPEFHLGLNIFFASKSISPEIWLLPKRFHCSEWSAYYSKNEKEEKDG